MSLLLEISKYDLPAAAVIILATWPPVASVSRGAGLINPDGTSTDCCAIQTVQSRLCFLFRSHLDKAKTFGATRFTVGNDL